MHTVVAVGAFALAAACAVAGGQREGPAGPPARVIVFLADGAGVAHWTAAYLAADAEGRTLAVASLPVTGLIDPRNVTRLKPESASGATAFATGVRTYYEAIGVGPDSLPRTTVLEAAETAGRATGIVTTTHLVDASPAAFLSHVTNRDEKAEIARQIAEQPVEVLMGDGVEWFDGSRGPNVMAALDERYVVVRSGDGLRALDADTVGALLGFFPIDTLRDPAARDPSLAEMTRAALAVLDRDPDGFFLLVENEHTDHSAHENRPAAVLAQEMLSLDDALREALIYRDRHPDTLIVVLADHETGGFSLFPTDAAAPEARYSTDDHTPELVPLFAVGPGAERFGGIHANDEIGRWLLEAVSSPEGESD